MYENAANTLKQVSSQYSTILFIFKEWQRKAVLTNKYQSLEDVKEILGDAANISKLFIEFQQYLYQQKIA